MNEPKAQCRIAGEDCFPGRFLRAALDGCVDTDLTVMNIAPGASYAVADAVRRLTDDTCRRNVVAVLHRGCPLPDGFEELAERHCVTLLRCPDMVGTGMTGLWRDVVNALYRGFYFHIDGNEARRSTVHALDVGRAAALAAGTPGDFTLGDGRNPRFEDMAEALSCRLDHKRIARLSPRKARLLLAAARLLGWRKTANRLEAQSADAVADTAAWTRAFPDFRFIDVAEYLKTHQYGQDDL